MLPFGGFYPTYRRTIMISDLENNVRDVIERYDSVIKNVGTEAMAKARSVDALGELLTDDAIWIAPNDPPYVGKSTILGEYRKVFERHTIDSFSRSISSINVAENIASIIGTYSQTMSGGKSSEKNTHFFLVLRCGTDGKWKIARAAWGGVVRANLE